MDSEVLKQRIERFPIMPLMVLYLAYSVGYDYLYDFLQDPGSPRNQKIAQISQIKQENIKLKEKIKQADEFLKNLEVKKLELQGLSQELDNMKATLTEGLDVPDFMKMIITEAKKVGLVVMSLKPLGEGKKEYYAEHAFELSFRGAYVQLLAFLDRLTQAQKVIRVDNFQVRPKGSTRAKYVELDGSVQIKTFSYIGSQADELRKKQGAPVPADSKSSGGSG